MARNSNALTAAEMDELGARFAEQDAATDKAIADGEDDFLDTDTPTYEGFANGGVTPRSLGGTAYEDSDGE